MAYGSCYLGIPGLGLAIQLVIFVLFFLVVYWILKGSGKNAGTPLEILKKRLARGEVTLKEFSELKKEIN